MIVTIINHFVLAIGATAFFAFFAVFIHRTGEKALGLGLKYAEALYGCLIALSIFTALIAGGIGFTTGLGDILSGWRAAEVDAVALYDSIACWFAIPVFAYAIDRAGKDWNATWACAKKLPANAVAYTIYVLALFYAQAVSVFTL